ncbi:MAG: group II intron reverse transcriptase domain-containing protein [Nitrospirae bacterium]|nr:group II intron reverse transcriptase domain-containing protein [Nitrospirota bacterium]
MASLFTFENLYSAYIDCRRKKRGKKAALHFEVDAEENLFALSKELADRTYRPSPSFCFVSKNDKYREIFAAQFRDRVVHHLVVRYLEKIWEPVFIHDSYACRKGKGTHAAVKRLQSFMRKATNNSTKRAWYLQLDIKAFFPSIKRKLLLDIVCSRLENEEMRWLLGVVILHDPTPDAIFTCSPEKWESLPAHKSLFSVPEGRGLPIGNLTSQFFANVYLNKLDQFIKHTLKSRYYLRYVDDFILLHESRDVLFKWKNHIGGFLSKELKLELHPNRQIISPVSNGINALGYIVRPSHLLVRRKVVNNCKRVITKFQNSMIKTSNTGTDLIITPEIYNKFNSVMNSYKDVFGCASSNGLIHGLFRRFKILKALFIRRRQRITKRWDIPFRPADLYTQFSFFRIRFKGIIVFQVGCFLELFDKDAVWAEKNLEMQRLPPHKGFYARSGVHIKKANSLADKISRYNYLLVLQSDYVYGKIHKRFCSKIHVKREKIAERFSD